MTSEVPEDTVEFWQKKCQEQEEIIRTLAGHCIKVVKKHEELLGNYQKTQSQYMVLVEKLKEQKQQVHRARDVLGPVMRAHQELKEKYDIAIRCQQEAESFATKVNSTNVKMKRQSQMIMSKIASGQNIVSIDFGDDNSEVEEEPKKYYESLDKKIEVLSAEKASLSASVKGLTEDLEIQKEKNVIMKKRLEEYKTELKRSNDRISRQGKELLQLAHTSEAALQEYHSLQEQYELEIISHKAANTRADRLKAESTAAKRQSAALMSNISGDQKLMKALIDLEELTTKCETDKMQFENKISSLEQELQDEKNKLGVQALEDETASLTKERDDLIQRLADSEKLANEAQSRCSELQGKYSELEAKYMKSQNEPRIPEPPPPPPPPPLPPVRLGIMALISGGKKKQKQIKKDRLAKGGAAVNQDWNKALDEMMQRIGSGKALKPVLKTRTDQGQLYVEQQSVPEDSSAVSELEGILKNMKKAKSEEDLTAMDDTFVDTESELGQTFKKILQKKQGTGTDMPSPRPVPSPRPRKLSTIKDVEEEDKA